MPNKRVFDLALLVVVLAKPAEGLIKIAARRWAKEASGPVQLVGQMVEVSF
jgi:hypothetical protein